MSVDIVTMEDCASNYGVFKVPSSKPGGVTYTVTFHGSEGPMDCTCDGFKFRQECRHVKQVWDDACLYNPQWRESKDDPALRPVDYTYHAFSPNKCACGGPMVYVKRAV